MGQADHYDAILTDYERHYFDRASMDYRHRYIYQPMFENLDLTGARICELASGSGPNSLEVLRRYSGVQVFGLDISSRACDAYRRQTGGEAHVIDLSRTGQDLPAPADAAIVVGGLHHCVNDLDAAIANAARLVKPGGLLIMVEPNARFVLNSLRTSWYRRDKWFREQEEAPLDHDMLARRAAAHFEVERVRYLGGPAYFLIINSLVTRIPHRVKGPLAPALFALDDLYNRLPGSAPYPMFIAHWRRLGA